MPLDKNSVKDYAHYEMPGSIIGSRKIVLQLGIVILIGLTVWVWLGILNARSTEDTVYVLNIGQGDSQLVLLTSRSGRTVVKILIDGGKDRRVLDALDEALGKLNNKYIDVVIMTHVDLDHMGGLIEVAKRYDIGLFVSNGRPAESDAYEALQKELTAHDVSTLTLLEGDTIRYGTNILSILSPDPTLLEHKEVNEASLVMMLRSDGKKILFTADAGFPAEQVLLTKGYDLKADVLKVGHHGSKYSSSENFLAAVRPTVSIIGVGKNTYGHPTARVLESLELAGSRIYRTDENGTVRVPLGDTAPQENTGTLRTGLLGAVASIFFGDYAKNDITTVSLREAAEEKQESKLVSFKECSYASGRNPAHSPVILNEVAWMGSSSGTTHEWIELQNLSGDAVNISGWQLINENEKLHVTFPQQSIFNPFDKLRAGGRFMVLARKAANDALDLNAKVTFTGSIRNNNEGLRLFDNTCRLIDEIPTSAQWPAGDNKTKQTMERTSDLLWRTSANVGGTPGF